MRDTLRLGKVGGVRVGVHWSLFAVMALLGLGLARNRLPFDAPGLGPAAYDIAGATTAIALVVAVLAHEAGHAAVARRAGLGVDGITLSWMGGVTRMEGEPPSPAWEVAVAGVGPAVSAVLGGLLVAARAIASARGPVMGTTGLVLAAVGWLGLINLGLAVFNLVPAAPLDGGRVLHGLMWRVWGDRWRATRMGSRLGIGIGALLVVAGFVTLADRVDGADALLLAVLGWWLISAARNDGQAGLVHRALEGATVADLMRPVGAAPGWLSVAAFVEAYDSPRPGWVWLLEGWEGRYQAVVAGAALRAIPPHQWGTLRPLDVAVPLADVAGAGPHEEALACLVRTGGRQVVLVVDGAHTVGAVLPADVEALVASGRRAAPGLVVQPAPSDRC